MLNIVLFGPPGAGKGTQSENLIKRYGLMHLSTGDIFRSNIKGGTELGQLAKQFIDQGALVPDEVTIGMLRQEVEKRPESKGFIFDGFPRTTAQAEALDQLLEDLDTSVNCMLALEVPEEELKERLRGRALTSGRSDDADPEVIRNRIATYNRETAPVADYYRSQGKYIGLNGVGSIEAIAERLFEAVDAHA
jgi:adenylate kinase